ncbi:MAG: CoA transferase [Candidatus Thermoplasmatota archaeon]|jgi:CoA:oxalate CoA-transferase|nr:CoA transferase [Candidatus Thermoplasmatota archaeon]
MRYDLLKGVKVVELGRVLSAPYSSKLLSDLGAEVTKIEAGEGDPYRGLPPKVGDKSVWFLNFNNGKKFLHIEDLNEWSRSVDVLESIKSADILIENFKPGLLKRYGLDFESLKRINPRIVYVSISAFGQEGPLSTKAGFDIVVQALSGYMINYDKEEIVHPHTYLSDYASGLFAAFASVSALLRKERTAVYIDVSMFDILVNWSAIFGIITQQDKTYRDLIFKMDPAAFPYGSFKTKDQKSVVIAAVGEAMVGRFYDAFREELKGEGVRKEDFLNPSNFRKLRDDVSGLISRISLTELEKKLTEHRIPWELVKSGLDLMNEPHVIEKKLFEELSVEGGKSRVASFPVRINT